LSSWRSLPNKAKVHLNMLTYRFPPEGLLCRYAHAIIRKKVSFFLEG
jgi:hypothetical protein